MKNITFSLPLTIITVLLVHGTVEAHSGRTDSSGCHNDNINGGYHCHNGGSSGGGGGSYDYDNGSDNDTCDNDSYRSEYGTCLSYPETDADERTTLKRGECPYGQYSVGDDCHLPANACTQRHGPNAEHSNDGECWCRDGYAFDHGYCKFVNTARSGRDETVNRIQRRLQENTRTSTNANDETTVNRVVDGDTLKVLINRQVETVRVIGIDTPETVDPRKAVQCFGKEASAKMKSLVEGKNVELQKNPAEERDKYDRLLRYIELNGQDIGAQMIRDGYAFSYKQYPHPRLEEYNRLEREAREAKRGLWSSCDEDDMSKGAALENDNEEFSDVTETHPYMQAIRWGKTSRVLNGYPDGTFQPDKTVNRAEFLKIVLEGKGVDVATATAPTKFTDVDENAWYAPYVRYAKANGIIQGYPDGSFKPSQPVNFAEALKMAYVALDVPSTETGGEWYEKFLRHAKKNSVLFSDNVNVGAGMSRKDVVWIVYKMMNHTGEWQQPEAATPKDEYDHYITHIELNGFPTSWDADAEDDGLELGANFYFKSKSNPDEPEQLGYPLNKDWTANVTIYDQETDDDTFQDKKGQLLFSHNYSQNEVQYNADGYPFVRIPIEQLKDAGKTYAWVEATFSSSRGTFSGQSKYMTVRMETDEANAADNQVKDLDLRSISGYAYWTNWDGDLEKDGFELQTYFKDVNDEQVYPNSKDWTVTVKIYNSESDYSKYKDFSTHKTTLANTVTYSGNKVRYESLGSPFVRVADEDMRGVTTKRMIVEATYSSPTYGTFSMAVETPDDRND